jgi:alpha-L-fucosidase
MPTLLRSVARVTCGLLLCAAVSAQPPGQKVAPPPPAPGVLRAPDIADQLHARREDLWAQTLQADDRLDWWREARFGMFIHWGLYAIPAGEWGGKTSHGEWIRTSAQIPLKEYDKLKESFNPTKFDARAWAKLAKAAGMKYITITTKHHDGFCLFDSKETDWDVMSTPFKRDIIKEMADACKEEGITLCFYYSIMDWHHPDYTPRRDWETWDTKGADYDRYVAYMKAQLKELLTNYGPIGVLWFDGQWEGNWNDERGKDLYDYVRSLQPDIIINSRVGRAGGDWGLDGESGPPEMIGDYATPEQTIPDEVPEGVDWETCMTMNGHWGYNRADKDFKTTQDLVRKLADIASKGGNFLLNVGPTAEGEIPAESIERLQAIGRWMAINGDSIHGTRRGTLVRPEWGRCTERTLPGAVTRFYLHVFDVPKDGKLAVPGLLNKAVSCSMMSSPQTALVATSTPDGVVVDLPKFESNGIDDVVVLDVKGAPDVAKAPVIEAPAIIFVDRLEAHVSSSQPGVQIRYTLDGTEPGIDSPVTTGEVTLQQTGILSARSFRDGKPVSPTAKLALTQVELRRAVRPSQLVGGLRFEYFQSGGSAPNAGVDMKSVDELNALKAIKWGAVAGFDTSVRHREKHWGMRFVGFIHVEHAGVYRFSVGSDDGSKLWIDDQLVVSNDGPHSYKVESGDMALAAGYHTLTLAYFENWGGFDLKVMWTPPGGKREPIPADRLFAAPR